MSSETETTALSMTQDASQNLTGMAQPNPSTTTGASKVATTATKLLADLTCVNATQNSDPSIKMIELRGNPLVSLFTNTIKPLVYANHRNLSVATVTNAVDIQTLDSITYTICVASIASLRAVAYYKAMRVNSGYLALFGGQPETDKLSFPALTTLLINSIGPIQRERESYRCIFIPYITANTIQVLYAHGDYNPRFEEVFALAMSRVHYSVVMTDVDIYNDKSSHWWTLHAVPETFDANQTMLTKNVYCPMSFNDIDHATTLASVCLEETLYEFPGPCHTAVVGPFASQLNPTYQTMPAQFRDDLHINVSPPVMLITFTAGANLSNADAVTFGTIQADNTIIGLASDRFRRANDHVVQYHGAAQAHADARVAHATTAAPVSPGNTGGTVALAGNARPAPGPAPPRAPHPPIIPGPQQGCGNANYRLYIARVLYFDHKLLSNFACSRIQHIVTEANRP